MKRAIMTITFSIIFFLLLIIIPNTVHAEEYFDSDNKYMELLKITRWGMESANELKYTWAVEEGERYRIAIKDYENLEEPEVSIHYLQKTKEDNSVEYDYRKITKVIKLDKEDSYGNNYYEFTAESNDYTFELHIDFKNDITEQKDILYDKVHVYHEAIYLVPTITNLNIETTTSTAVLTWSGTDESDDEYEIFKVKADGLKRANGYYKVEENQWEEVVRTKDKTYTFENLEEDTRYVFSIETCRKRNGIEYRSGKPLPKSATTTVSPLPVVKNLRVVENSPSTLEIAWDPVWDTIGPYHYYQIECYDFEEEKWVTEQTYYKETSYNFKPPEGRTTYKYRIRACIDSKWNDYDIHPLKYVGAYSNEIEVVTEGAKPQKVTNLKVFSQTESSITLRWDSMLYATCYEIAMFDDETLEWKVLGNTPNSLPRYQVNNLQKDKEYKFRVRGIHKTTLAGNLEGEYSDELTVTLNSDKEKECLHSKTTVHNAKNATCTEKGYTGDIYCKDCDTKLSDGTEIPATGHKGGKATCVEKAKCEVCGEYYGEVNQENHVGTEVQNKKDETCTEAGNTGDTYCTGCKKELEKGKEIPATGHKGGKATCTKRAKCEVCGVEYGEVDSTNHENTEIRNVKEAKCTEKGCTGDIYCKDCNTKLSAGKEIPATGHKGGKATCTKKAKCEVCGAEYGNLNSTNHVNRETRNVKNATCTGKGYTGDIYCKDCNKKISSGKEIPATGHKGGKATFTKGAICEICGVEYTKKLEEEKHKYPSNITFQDNYLKAGKTITIRQNANGKSVSFISLLADIVKSAIENKFPGLKVASKLTGNIGTGKVVKLSNGDNITVIYKGDVNGDGKVSIADAGMMVRSSFGKIKLTEAQKKAGDIGGRIGEVNSSDAGVVVRLLFGGKNAEKAYNKIAEYMPEDML